MGKVVKGRELRPNLPMIPTECERSFVPISSVRDLMELIAQLLFVLKGPSLLGIRAFEEFQGLDMRIC
jgi:hypothetical protein